MQIVTKCLQCGATIRDEIEDDDWEARYVCDACKLKNPTHLVNQSITGFNYSYLWKQSETQALNELKTFIKE